MALIEKQKLKEKFSQKVGRKKRVKREILIGKENPSNFIH
jgi:hypothetical protein